MKLSDSCVIMSGINSETKSAVNASVNQGGRGEVYRDCSSYWRKLRLNWLTLVDDGQDDADEHGEHDVESAKSHHDDAFAGSMNRIASRTEASLNS